MKIHTAYYLWPDGKTIGCTAWTKDPFKCQRFTIDAAHLQRLYVDQSFMDAIKAYCKKRFQEIGEYDR